MADDGEKMVTCRMMMVMTQDRRKTGWDESRFKISFVIPQYTVIKNYMLSSQLKNIAQKLIKYTVENAYPYLK